MTMRPWAPDVDAMSPLLNFLALIEDKVVTPKAKMLRNYRFCFLVFIFFEEGTVSSGNF